MVHFTPESSHLKCVCLSHIAFFLLFIRTNLSIPGICLWVISGYRSGATTAYGEQIETCMLTIGTLTSIHKQISHTEQTHIWKSLRLSDLLDCCNRMAPFSSV